MSRDTEQSCKGKYVFFTLGSTTDAQKLKDSLDQMGLGKLCPSSNTKLAALHQALTSVCANRRRLVRPLPKKQRGYSVVSEAENMGGKSLKHTVDFDVPLPDKDGVVLEPIFIDPETQQPCIPPEEAQILHRYQIELGRLPAHKVSGVLVRALDHFHAVTVRPSGGFYWIPEGAVEKFRKVAKAVEESCTDGSNVVYFTGTAMDDDLRKAVIAGLQNSIQGEVETIEKDVMAQSYGKRAAKTKQERCARLRKRVRGYEKMFAVTLQGLAENLATVESALVIATFEAASSKKGK